MSSYIFQLANGNNEAELRGILENNPIIGKISIVFKRDPNYFWAAKVGSRFNQTIIVKDKKINKIVGLGNRSIYSAYLNGKVCHLGYLSNLRINNNYRNSLLLSRGYQYLKSLHQDKKTPIYITTIIEDNKLANNLLTSQRAGLPTYHKFGTYHTLVVPTSGKKRKNNGDFEIKRGSKEKLDEIIDCIHRNGSQKQFYPFFNKEDFISGNEILRDFKIEDFYLALKKDKIIGVVAKWDQSNFKQTIITSYQNQMKFTKPFYNLYARVLGYPPLPKPNSSLSYFYLSFIAVNSNSPQIFRGLLQAIYNDTDCSKYTYFLVGLHTRDPLLKVVKEHWHITYKSYLYIVYWKDGEEIFKELDNRIPYLEISML